MFIFHYIINLWRFHFPRRFINFWWYVSLLLRGWRPWPRYSWRKGSLFYIASKGDRVLKIPKCTNFASVEMSVDTSGFQPEYDYFMKRFSHLDMLTAHLPTTRAVYRNGSYQMTYVPGHDLQSLWQKLVDAKPLPSDLDVESLIAAMDELLLNVEKMKETYWAGLWTLSNLIFDQAEGRLYNVSTHNCYLYDDEYSWYTLELLKERFADFKEKFKVPGKQYTSVQSEEIQAKIV